MTLDVLVLSTTSGGGLAADCDDRLPVLALLPIPNLFILSLCLRNFSSQSTSPAPPPPPFPVRAVRRRSESVTGVLY